MKRILAALLLVIPSGADAFDDCAPSIAALNTLYDVRYVMLQSNFSSYEVQTRVNQHLDTLREPLPDGGYRWVQWVRPGGDGPVEKDEHLISSVRSKGEVETLEAEGDRAFVVRVAVPRKRTTFRQNNPVYVGAVNIRYWVDGRQKTIAREINGVIAPDNWKIFDLGVIADRAEVTVDVAAAQNTPREALVEVHFRQAVPQDDPSGPSYEAILALKRISESSTPAILDAEIARFERSLFPALSPTPYLTIAEKLREADTLMKSTKPEAQEKAKTLFDEAVKLLPRE